MIQLVYLDRYHLDDRLLARALARGYHVQKDDRAPTVLVHGSGEAAERMLEAEGTIPRRQDGVLVVEPGRNRARVERAVREANQRLVGRLTEEGVPVVSVQGVDLGLLRIDESGRVSARRGERLRSLAERGAVPVVSSLARAANGETVELAPLRALLVLAGAVEEGKAVQVLFLTTNRRAGVEIDGVRVDALRVDAPEWISVVSEPDVVEGVVRAGYPVYLGHADAVFDGDSGRRTQIKPG